MPFNVKMTMLGRALTRSPRVLAPVSYLLMHTLPAKWLSHLEVVEPAWYPAAQVPADFEGQLVWQWCEGWRGRGHTAKPVLVEWSEQKFSRDEEKTWDVYFAKAELPELPNAENIVKAVNVTETVAMDEDTGAMWNA